MNDREQFEEKLKLLVAYDPITGQMWWKAKPNRNIRIGQPIGRANCWGHMSFGMNGKTLMVHRVAWFLYYGEWPVNQIDHINGDKQDNRISNLRDVPQRINMQNQISAHKNNISGFLGVIYRPDRPKKWRASIKVNGKNISLGYYDTPEKAHAVYLDAKKTFHEEHFKSLEEHHGK